MLSRQTVAQQLGAIATAQGRKFPPERAEIYHRVLQAKLSEYQFVAACKMALEEDSGHFPTIGHLIDLGRGSQERMAGVPYVIGSDRSEIGPLSTILSEVNSHQSILTAKDQFRGRPHAKPYIEELVYDDAVVTTPQEPGEGILSRAARIAAKADEVLARMATQEARHATQTTLDGPERGR